MTIVDNKLYFTHYGGWGQWLMCPSYCHSRRLGIASMPVTSIWVQYNAAKNSPTLPNVCCKIPFYIFWKLWNLQNQSNIFYILPSIHQKPPTFLFLIFTVCFKEVPWHASPFITHPKCHHPTHNILIITAILKLVLISFAICYHFKILLKDFFLGFYFVPNFKLIFIFSRTDQKCPYVYASN